MPPRPSWLIYSTYLAINKNEQSRSVVPALRAANRVPAPAPTRYAASLSGSVGISSACLLVAAEQKRKGDESVLGWGECGVGVAVCVLEPSWPTAFPKQWSLPPAEDPVGGLWALTD